MKGLNQKLFFYVSPYFKEKLANLIIFEQSDDFMIFMAFTLKKYGCNNDLMV